MAKLIAGFQKRRRSACEKIKQHNLILRRCKLKENLDFVTKSLYNEECNIK